MLVLSRATVGVFDSLIGRALMLIIASRSDPSVFFLARFHLGLYKGHFYMNAFAGRNLRFLETRERTRVRLPAWTTCMSM